MKTAKEDVMVEKALLRQGKVIMNTNRIAFTLRNDSEETTEFEIVRAYALVCQDLENKYVVMSGKMHELKNLYAWGLLNYGFASPLPELTNAVNSVLRKNINNDSTHCSIRLPQNLPNTKNPNTLSVAWTMDVTIRCDGNTPIILSGMTDLILMFLTTACEQKVATGGSGMQKAKLAEMGVRNLFGEKIAKDFNLAFHGPISPFIERIRKQMLDKSRRSISGGPGISIETILLPHDNND